MLVQEAHFVKGLDAVADAFASTVYSDIVNMEGFGCCTFILHKGVGTTGTSTITVEASDDVSGSNVTAVEFWYKAITSGDTPGAVTAAATTGFATTAGSSQLYVISVPADKLSGVGKKFVRLKAAEVVDAAVLGGILIIMTEPRFSVDTDTTAIV